MQNQKHNNSFIFKLLPFVFFEQYCRFYLLIEFRCKLDKANTVFI